MYDDFAINGGEGIISPFIISCIWAFASSTPSVTSFKCLSTRLRFYYDDEYDDRDSFCFKNQLQMPGGMVQCLIKSEMIKSAKINWKGIEIVGGRKDS